MYLNGQEIASTDIPVGQIPWIPADTEGGDCGPRFNDMMAALGIGRGYNTLYKGHMDEVRIWQVVRTPEQIQRDYTRILTGGEEGLISYYRLDESYGYGAYDLSHDNYEFNKNDLEIGVGYEDYWPIWSDETPSFEQLHPSGITDGNGNYIIKGIRYSGNGNVFSVSPFLGVHEFNPTDITLFIGDGNPVHNNVDFIDQSAFDFTGTVYYAGTNFPVEGADVYIDNTQQFDAGGNPIQTNQYGQISISVPIGQHYISVKKDGHLFTNNGQWPSPTENDDYPTYNFQDNVNNITFYDETTVVLAGRFVGGDVEGDKTIGFDKSNANIGQGQIVFKNEAGYDIDTDPNNATNALTIFTDNESGEYEIELIPGIYKIDSVWNDHYQMDNLDLGTIDLREIPEPTIVTDTLISEEIVDDDTIITVEVFMYQYDYLRNFIYYNEPTIYLFGEDGQALIGEHEYYYTDPDTEETDTIDLISASPFNYPVFVMGNNFVIYI